MKRLLLLPIFLLFTFTQAQEYWMENGGVTTCSGTFYDSGGPNGNYGPNEELVYTICPDRTSDPELAIVLDFYSVLTQGNVDIINVYDGDDTSAPLIITLSGNNPAIVAASDASVNPSGCLTVEFISDAVGQGPGWEAEISCQIPCQVINPNVSTTPAMDVDGNVTILEGETVEFMSSPTFSQDDSDATYTWDFGDGTTATGTNVSHTYPDTGTYTVTYTITDNSGNPDCTVVYTFFVIVTYDINTPCPDVNPRDVYTETTDNILVNCNYPLDGNGCIRLEANYTELNSSDQYVVVSIPFQPPFPIDDQEGLVSITTDDEWSSFTLFDENSDNVADFNICFFGIPYEGVVVGDNGMISFNQSYAGDDCPWDMYNVSDDTYDMIPQNNFPSNSTSIYTRALNSVLGAAYDLYIPAGDPDESFFGFGILGDENCKAFVVNYKDIPLYSCNDLLASQQIVLYESSGIIDVYIENKPQCSWNGNAAVVGVINADGTQGIAAPARNTSSWSAQNEAWRFIPDGDPLNVDIVWKDENGNIISEDLNEIEVCPTGDTFYTVEVTYEICGQDPITVTDDVYITFDLEAPQVDDREMELCDALGDETEVWNLEEEVAQLITDNPEWTILGFYTEFRGANEQDPDYLIADPINYTSGEGTVYAVVQGGNGCVSIFEIELIFAENLSFDPLSDTRCMPPDTNNLTYDLNDFLQDIDVGQIFDAYFYTDLADAESGASNYLQGTDITEFTITETTTIYIRIVTEDGCFGILELLLEINTANFNYTFDNPVQFCDTDEVGSETVDLTNSENDISGGATDVTFYYYENYDDALANETTLAIPDATSYILNGTITEIYIVVQDANMCYKIITMPVSLLDVLNLTPQSISLCDEGYDNTEIWDLTTKNDEIIANSNQYDFTYYPTQQDLVDNTNQIPDPNAHDSVETTIYVLVTTQDGCSFETTLELILNNLPQINPAELFVCGDDNGTLVFDLTEAETQLLNGQTGITLTYFNTLADAENGDPDNAIADLTNYTGTVAQIIYVLMENENCSAISQITLNEFPEVLANQPQNITTCDVDASGNEDVDLTSLEAEIVAGQTGVTVSYHATQDDASNGENAIPTPDIYTAISGTTTIFVRVESGDNCYATTTFDVIINSGPELFPQNITLCDENGDGSQNFDLTSLNDEITGGITTNSIGYYQSIQDINDGNPITTDVTQYASGGETIYVLVTNEDDCPSYTELELNLKPLPTVSDSPWLVCDPEFDGVYGFTLTDLDALVVSDASNYTFEYYTSLSDAENQISPMTQAQADNITIIPFNVYVRITEQSGEPLCSNFAVVELNQGEQTQVNADIDALSPCDEGSGSASFDLTEMASLVTSETTDHVISYHNTLADAENDENPINPENAVLSSGTVYVRVTAENKCPSITEFDVEITPVPLAEINASATAFCSSESLTISANGFNPDYTYQWTNQFGNILGDTETIELDGAAGDQTVTLTVTDPDSANGCFADTSMDFDAVNVPQIINLEVTEESIAVETSGQGPFEYSLNGIDWQDEPYFNDLAPGYYQVYVRSVTSQCDGIGMATLVLDISHVITPNGDGLNDAFVIPFMDAFRDDNGDVQASYLSIYNRYGKLVFSDVSSNDKIQFVWNGYYNGRPVTTGDYWYILKLADGRTTTGHITVKNR